MTMTILLAAAAVAGKTNIAAVGFFGLFVTITLGITYWAAKQQDHRALLYSRRRHHRIAERTRPRRRLHGAASFLGIVGMVSQKGYDGLILLDGFLVGWPIVMFTIAEPLRNLGKYTFADVVASRLKQRPVRAAATLGTLSVVIIYMIAQMVGAGNLIKLLFGFDYPFAVILVGTAMLSYVFFGGMVATTSGCRSSRRCCSSAAPSPWRCSCWRSSA